jgi:hypothetical protein
MDPLLAELIERFPEIPVETLVRVFALACE